MKIKSFTRAVTHGAIGAGVAFAAIAQSAAQTPSDPTADTNATEIVVIAQRSGIPVWRVTGPRTTVVLLGSIGSVSPSTQWDPVPLDAALAKADRVMFPERMDISFGLFSIIGAIGKFRKQASLPKGETLQMMTTPAQWARLVALRDRGILKPGFERTHPYHLAMTLNRQTRDRRKLAPGVDPYVRRFLGNNKAKRVPLAQGSLKEITVEFFGTAPRTHVACLMDAVTRVEAGAAGMQARAEARDARSAAWATRRVPDALAARADDGQRSCWPRGSRLEPAREASLSPTIQGLMRDPQVTLAVMSLETLARPGGILDDLTAAGFDIRGPRWKR